MGNPSLTVLGTLSELPGRNESERQVTRERVWFREGSGPFFLEEPPASSA